MVELNFHSLRMPVIGRRGMVATSQPLAVAAGLEILAGGGNAADAAIATAAALSVTEPNSTGLGGDCFALYLEAQSGKITALNGSGRAPGELSLGKLHQEGFKQELPKSHAYNITVPGACAGWFDLVERFGRLDMVDILAPAIRLAEEGFPVAPITAAHWQKGAESLLRSSPGGLELTINGRGPQPGEIFRNPGLAHTLKTIAAGGKEAFYQGEIAEAMVRVVRAAGGCLNLNDLANHHSTWEEPIRVPYRDINIWECPPNGQGIAALLALNILESYDIRDLPPLSPQRLHLEIEALRLAFADTNWYVADPAFVKIPIEELLSKEYAASRRELINTNQATLNHTHGQPLSSSDTIYMSVVDGDGNACSFLNSNYSGFGTGIVPSGWGFSIQNRGNLFSLDPQHPNALAPGKRPYHTIIPALATRPPGADGQRGNQIETLFACFGVMGGSMQPQGHVQVTIGLIDDHLDPQSALDRPRFCIVDGEANGSVYLEEGIPIKTMAALAEMGHTVIPVSGEKRSVFGRGQIIQNDPLQGVLWGGSDPRADGCVMTY